MEKGGFKEMFEGLELAEKYLEELHKHPFTTLLWTAGAVIAIVALVIYSRWHERKNNRKHW